MANEIWSYNKSFKKHSSNVYQQKKMDSISNLHRRGPIPFKTEVKYLGVILDAKLLGTSHVKHKLGKAKRHLMAYHYAITKK